MVGVFCGDVGEIIGGYWLKEISWACGWEFNWGCGGISGVVLSLESFGFWLGVNCEEDWWVWHLHSFLALVSSLSLLHFWVLEQPMGSLVLASWFFFFCYFFGRGVLQEVEGDESSDSESCSERGVGFCVMVSCTLVSCMLVSLGASTLEIVTLGVVILGLFLFCLSSLLFFLLETIFHPSSWLEGLVGLGPSYMSAVFSTAAILGSATCWLGSLLLCGQNFAKCFNVASCLQPPPSTVCPCS